MSQRKIHALPGPDETGSDVVNLDVKEVDALRFNWDPHDHGGCWVVSGSETEIRLYTPLARLGL